MGYPAFMTDGGAVQGERSPMPLPRWWKLLARAEYKRQGWTQQRLAARVGCSQSNVNQALALSDKQSSKTSEYASAISRVLGIPEPAVIPSSGPRSALFARMLVAAEAIAERDDEALEAQVAMFEALAKLRKK